MLPFLWGKTSFFHLISKHFFRVYYMPGTMLIAKDIKFTGQIFASRGSQAGAQLLLIFWLFCCEYEKGTCQLNICSLGGVSSAFQMIKGYLYGGQKPRQSDLCYIGDADAGYISMKDCMVTERGEEQLESQSCALESELLDLSLGSE